MKSVFCLECIVIIIIIIIITRSVLTKWRKTIQTFMRNVQSPFTNAVPS